MANIADIAKELCHAEGVVLSAEIYVVVQNILVLGTGATDITERIDTEAFVSRGIEFRIKIPGLGELYLALGKFYDQPAVQVICGDWFGGESIFVATR